MSPEELLRSAVDRFLSRVRQDTEARLQDLASDLLQVSEASRTAADRAVVDSGQAVARAAGHARHDLMSRVVGAIRRLDEASTLSGLLDALVEAACLEAARAAVLVVEGARVRLHRQHGFDAHRLPLDLDLGVSPAVAHVVNGQQTGTLHAPLDAGAPGLLRVASADVAMVIPLIVGGQVVALLSAEGPARTPGDPGEPVWSDHVEVVARHATGRLESLTSSRTVALLGSVR